MTYRLFECDLGHASCDPIPIMYTKDNVDFLVLEADETTKEINLYDELSDSDERILIFSYSEHPRCYVEGCEILEK